jgi:Fe-S-cluster containining protein
LCCGDTAQKTRHILVLEKEADAISAKTSLPKQQFSSKVGGKAPYNREIQKTAEGKCVFLKDNQCTIYDDRPLICRFYPFELKHCQEKETHVFNFTLECPAIGKGRMLTNRDFEELFLLAQQKLR